MKTNLLDELQTYKKQNEERSQILEELIIDYEKNNGNDDFEKRLISYLIKEENYSLRTRESYLHLSKMAIQDEHDIYSPELCDHLAAEINFKMTLLENDTWQITMPMLLNRQGNTKSKWVTKTIGPIIRNAYYKEMESHQADLKRPTHMTIAFIHHYDVNSYKNHLTDTDNYEIKTFIDCLKPYLLSSDSVNYLGIYQIGKKDTAFYTEVTLMPSTKFREWIKLNEQAQKSVNLSV